MMFSAFCPTHDATILMTRRNVTGFVNTDHGPILQWRCNCGHEGVLDRTGSTPTPTPAATTAPATAAAPAFS